MKSLKQTSLLLIVLFSASWCYPSINRELRPEPLLHARHAGVSGSELASSFQRRAEVISNDDAKAKTVINKPYPSKIINKNAVNPDDDEVEKDKAKIEKIKADIAKKEKELAKQKLKLERALKIQATNPGVLAEGGQPKLPPAIKPLRHLSLDGTVTPTLDTGKKIESNLANGKSKPKVEIPATR